MMAEFGPAAGATLEILGSGYRQPGVEAATRLEEGSGWSLTAPGVEARALRLQGKF